MPQAHRTNAEARRSRELDHLKEDLPLPPPTSYMSPPNGELAQQLGRDGQHPPTDKSPAATETTHPVDSPEPTSVDEVLISLGVPPTNSASGSPIVTSPPRGMSFRSQSPDLVRELETATRGPKVPSKPTREHDSAVLASTQARHQRRGMERQLRKSQKQFQQAMTNGDVDDKDELGSESNSPGAVPHNADPEEHLKAVDPSDFIREGMEIDPRNLIDAPSPIYDRLENLPPPLEGSPEEDGLGKVS